MGKPKVEYVETTQKQELDPIAQGYLWSGQLPGDKLASLRRINEQVYGMAPGTLTPVASAVSTTEDVRDPRGLSDYGGAQDDRERAAWEASTGYGPVQGPNQPRSGGGFFGGYSGVGDMFDGGGPGRSGDRFEGGGRLSDIGNAVTGRGPEAQKKANGGMVALADGGSVYPTYQTMPRYGDSNADPDDKLASLRRINEQVYGMAPGTLTPAAPTQGQANPIGGTGLEAWLRLASLREGSPFRGLFGNHPFRVTGSPNGGADNGGPVGGSSAGGGFFGYDNPIDMVDRGGPGASGGNFQGGGRMSDIANAVTGRGPEAQKKANGGMVALADGGSVYPTYQTMPRYGDSNADPDDKLASLRRINEQVYGMAPGTLTPVAPVAPVAPAVSGLDVWLKVASLKEGSPFREVFGTRGPSHYGGAQDDRQQAAWEASTGYGPVQEPNQPRSGGGFFGYDSPIDMVDRGGPGASGGNFQGGGRMSDIANAVTGRGPEAQANRMANGGIVALANGGMVPPMMGGRMPNLSNQDMAYQMAMQAMRPRPYAMGGYIEGPGTGTSDSIPAKIYQDGQPVQEAALSDGEFVMTERAVRGAGNGDPRAGAARMYEMMRKFERGGRVG